MNLRQSGYSLYIYLIYCNVEGGLIDFLTAHFSPLSKNGVIREKIVRYNRGAKHLPQLTADDIVRVRDESRRSQSAGIGAMYS